MPRRKSKRTNPRKLHDAAIRVEKQALREIEREAAKLGPFEGDDGEPDWEDVNEDSPGEQGTIGT